MTFWQTSFEQDDIEELWEECECGGCAFPEQEDFACQRALIEQTLNRLERNGEHSTGNSSANRSN